MRLDEVVARDVADSMLPALADGQSVQEASAQLTSEQRATARDLLGILQDHGLLVATAAERSAGPAPIPEPHPGDQSLVVAGDGALLAGLAAVLRQCGRDVRIAEPGPADTAPRPADGLASQTLAVADGESPPFCHVATNDDGVCWSFADARDRAPVAPALGAFRRAASWGATTECFADPGSRISPETFMTIAAQQIARHILRPDRARLPAGAVAFLDRRTLRTSTHNVTAHPYDVPARQRTQDELRRDLREVRDGPPLGQRELIERWQRLSDKRFGAFAELDDAGFRQLPLKVTLARMSDPCGLLPAPSAVVGVGSDSESARERAMLQALAAYGCSVVDPRLLVDDTGTFLGPPDGDAARLLRSVRDGSVDAFVRAIDLTNGRERLLPAQWVFPGLRAPGPGPAPWGTSAALDWQQALTNGLLQHCVRLSVSARSFRTRLSSALAAEEFDHDSGVRYLAAMVRASAIDVTLHKFTGPTGIPIVACALTSGETVYGVGVDLVEAVREALTAALFRYQLRCDSALDAIVSTATPEIWTNPSGPAAVSPDRLVHALAGMGYRPCVFALDHDRAVHEAFPYVLRVVLEQCAADLSSAFTGRVRPGRRGG